VSIYIKMETWKSIVGFENYDVSDLGNVRNVKSGKVLKPYNNGSNYLCVDLRGDTRKKNRVHRLVLQAFLPIEEDLECNHKNHITTDNRLENLEWCSHSQNNRFRRKRKNCSSQYIGVFWGGKNKWRVTCSLNNKQIHIGYFYTEEEGAEAYNNFVVKNNLQDFNILNIIPISINV